MKYLCNYMNVVMNIYAFVFHSTIHTVDGIEMALHNYKSVYTYHVINMQTFYQLYKTPYTINVSKEWLYIYICLDPA